MVGGGFPTPVSRRFDSVTWCGLVRKVAPLPRTERLRVRFPAGPLRRCLRPGLCERSPSSSAGRACRSVTGQVHDLRERQEQSARLPSDAVRVRLPIPAPRLRGPAANVGCNPAWPGATPGGASGRSARAPSLRTRLGGSELPASTRRGRFRLPAGAPLSVQRIWTRPSEGRTPRSTRGRQAAGQTEMSDRSHKPVQRGATPRPATTLAGSVVSTQHARLLPEAVRVRAPPDPLGLRWSTARL